MPKPAYKPTTTRAIPLPKHRPTEHAKQITARQEPGPPGSRSSTPGRRRADRRSTERQRSFARPFERARAAPGGVRPWSGGPITVTDTAGVRLRGRADDRWTRCSELLVSSRKRSTRQPELSQAGPSDPQRGGRPRAHLNTANCRAAARAPSVQTRPFECRPCYFPLLSDVRTYGRTQIALWEKGCYVRGRLLGRLAPPVPRASPRYAGGR